MKYFSIAIGAIFVILAACSFDSRPSPPETKVEMIEENIHGVTVRDPYRWLEDGESEDTTQWVAKQAQYARSVLDRYPHRDKLRARLTEILSSGSITRPDVAAGRYFYAKKEGDQNQPIVYLREGLHGEDQVLLDPNKGSAEGTLTIDWFTPSEDGRLLAYGSSRGGDEISSLFVLDVDKVRALPYSIPKVRFANPQWLKDSSGFYYTRPRDVEDIGPGEEVYYRRVFLHKLHRDYEKDEMIFGSGLPKEEIPDAKLSPDGRYLMLDVFMGWGKNRLYVRDLERDQLMTIAEDGENSYTGEIVGNTLYLLTNWNASRYQVFAVDLRKPERKDWRKIIPEGKGVIDSIKVVGDKLFAVRVTDAHSELLAFSLGGKQQRTVPLPEIGTVAQFHGKTDAEEAFFEFTSFTTPSTIYRLDVTADVGKPEALSVWNRLNAPIDSSQYESKQVFYPSKDGTIVPMYIVHKKGIALDGSTHGLLYGYGGFNISLTPEFRGYFFPWLESGGVLAIANMRGGSEYGEAWHRAGMLDKKQNVFDDFIAAAEYLIQKKYVAADRLVAHGRSNGGLLMGAVMTQRPDLFRVVICGVPLLDMIRYHKFRMARLWISEYGSAENEEDFQWLYAYSPYHQVKDGESYPATIIYTAESDSRVDPMHALKMTARLQAANASDNPIVLRFDTEAGHGAGKPLTKTIDEWVDIWSFTFDQLEIEY